MPLSVALDGGAFWYGERRLGAPPNWHRITPLESA